MQINQITKSQIQPGIWDGGKTWELFIYPKTAVYAQRNFDFRISTASIEKSPSDFTRFKGYKRYLAMLDNELELIRNGQKEFYQKNELFSFDSDDQIQSFSAGNDFNLMIDPTAQDIQVEWISDSFQFSKNFGFIFAVQPTKIQINQQDYLLQATDTLVFKNDSEEKIEVKTDGKVIFGSWNKK